MNVTVIFSKSRNWFAPISWLVRLLDGTPFSHVSVLVDWDKDHQLMFEASGSDVHLIGQSTWQEQHIVVDSVHRTINDAQTRDCLDFIVNTLEVPYSHLEFIGLGIARLFGLSRVPRRLRRGYVCSTLVAHVLGLPNPDSLDPKAVWEQLTKQGA